MSNLFKKGFASLALASVMASSAFSDGVKMDVWVDSFAKKKQYMIIGSIGNDDNGSVAVIGFNLKPQTGEPMVFANADDEGSGNSGGNTTAWNFSDGDLTGDPHKLRVQPMITADGTRILILDPAKEKYGQVMITADGAKWFKLDPTSSMIKYEATLDPTGAKMFKLDPTKEKSGQVMITADGARMFSFDPALGSDSFKIISFYSSTAGARIGQQGNIESGQIMINASARIGSKKYGSNISFAKMLFATTNEASIKVIPNKNAFAA